MVRHRRPEVYDFWVCPGGGVQGTETLETAAEREVKEETGLDITALRLAYVEEFFNPETRYVKFWFTGALVGGTLDTTHPETVREHIIEAAWRAEEEIKQGLVFPEFMQGRFWDDMERGFPSIVRVPLRKMTVW